MGPRSLLVSVLLAACAAPIDVDAVQVAPLATSPAAVEIPALDAPAEPIPAPEWSPGVPLFADRDVEPAPAPVVPPPAAEPPAVEPVATPDYLAFRIDDSLPDDDQAALRAALTTVTERWARATCLPVRVSDDAPHVVTMRARDEMYRRALGRTEGKWRALVITVARGYGAEPILLHELAHAVGRTNDHAAVHVDADGTEHAAFARSLHPHAQITPLDLDVVCAARACGCFAPEIVDAEPTE